MELLMRGPLHEAFAEAPQSDPVPNPAVPRQPPAPVNELPPEYKPAGENVQWIPGYWAWDDERQDFIWISGIWRDFPPGQRWVPGFWEASEGGFRWINGFWIDAAQAQLQYYPPPPENLDVGPSTPAPSDDHFYAPGHWTYQTNQYVWQPGCWLPIRPDWVWVPPCYVWTPYGCVFRPGYWDRLFDCRGMVFAPVCYNRPVYFDFNYVYTPSCVINTGYDLLPHLFVRRHCRSYYFGDWYDDRYWGNDFCAWSQIGYRRGFCGGYDPFYSYYSHVGIQFNQVNLMFWIRSQNDDCRQHVAHRPPHTYAGQRDWEQRRRNDPRRGQLAVADPTIHSPLAEQLDQRVKRINNPAVNPAVAARKFERIDVEARRNLQRQQQAAARAELENRRRADRDSTAAKLAMEQATRRQATAQKIESARQSQAAREAQREVERQRQSANRATELQARKEKAVTQQADVQDRLQQVRAARDAKLQQQAADREAQKRQIESQNQARDLENAQRRAMTEEKLRAAEQQRNVEREARRQSAGQQLQQQKAEAQQRQSELQQRRASELAAAQAASQQKAAERETRRQQESAQRVAQAQQLQQQQAQRASQERAAREAQNQQRQAQEQQRSAQRQAQLESMRQRQQAEQQQRQVERQQRDSERQQRNQDRGGKRGGK